MYFLCWGTFEKWSTFLTNLKSTLASRGLGFFHAFSNFLLKSMKKYKKHKKSKHDTFLMQNVSHGINQILIGMHHWHPLVGVADAPRPQILPVRLPFLSFALPRKGEFFSLDRISLKSMTKLRHETVGSASVSVSSAAYDLALFAGGWVRTENSAHPRGEGERGGIELLLKAHGDSAPWLIDFVSVPQSPEHLSIYLLFMTL